MSLSFTFSVLKGSSNYYFCTIWHYLVTKDVLEDKTVNRSKKKKKDKLRYVYVKRPSIYTCSKEDDDENKRNVLSSISDLQLFFILSNSMSYCFNMYLILRHVKQLLRFLLQWKKSCWLAFCECTYLLAEF